MARRKTRVRRGGRLAAAGTLMLAASGAAYLNAPSPALLFGAATGTLLLLSGLASAAGYSPLAHARALAAPLVGRRLAERYGDAEKIRAMDWKSFERLVDRHYASRGCVRRGDNALGPDDGIDLDLRCGKRRILVQCKQWKQKVGVSTVREMYGVMVAERADEVHIVAGGGFTRGAREFAKDKPIRLVGGRDLAAAIRAFGDGGEPPEKRTKERPEAKNEILCPRCGSLLRVRTVRRGPRRGERFLGCSNFPDCTYTQNL